MSKNVATPETLISDIAYHAARNLLFTNHKGASISGFNPETFEKELEIESPNCFCLHTFKDSVYCGCNGDLIRISNDIQHFHEGTLQKTVSSDFSIEHKRVIKKIVVRKGVSSNETLELWRNPEKALTLHED